MKLHGLGLVVAAIATIAACGDDDDSRECDTSADCLQGGIAGRCLPSPSSNSTWCAFADPACDSGERWGVKAGDGLASECVDEGGVDAGVDAAVDSGVDAAVEDASVVDAGVDAGPSDPLALRFGGESADHGNAVAVAPDGGFALVGFFVDPVDLGGGMAGQAGVNGFVARYSASGAHVWSRTFAGVGLDVAVDGSGDVLVVGSFSGTINLGGDDLTSSGGSEDALVAKFDGLTGAHQWSVRYGGSANDRAETVAVDSAGNVVVGGHFGNTVNFGGANLVSAGGFDLFAAKLLGTDAAHQWSIRFGGTSNEQEANVAIDSNGDVAIAGEFRATANFGDGDVASQGVTDGFVTKRLGASGGHVWSRTFGAAGFDAAYDVDFDGSDNVVLGGAFSDTVSLGGADLVSAGNRDGFVAQFDGDTGGHSWSNAFGSTDLDEVHGVAAVAGSVFVVGEFLDAVDFGGGPLSSAGSIDVFVAQYSGTGAHITSRRFGGTSFEDGNCVVAPGGSDLFVIGSFRETVDFGAAVLSAAGNSDIFVMRTQL